MVVGVRSYSWSHRQPVFVSLASTGVETVSAASSDDHHGNAQTARDDDEGRRRTRHRDTRHGSNRSVESEMSPLETPSTREPPPGPTVNEVVDISGLTGQSLDLRLEGRLRLKDPRKGVRGIAGSRR